VRQEIFEIQVVHELLESLVGKLTLFGFALKILRTGRTVLHKFADYSHFQLP
jgi:hypothetical protein